jgi:hypothetical protein
VQNRGAAKREPVQRSRSDDDRKGRRPKDGSVLAVLSWMLITPRRGAPGRRQHRQAAGVQDLSASGLRLFDHLISSPQECRRNGNAQRIGGFEIDDQLELGRLLDRDVGHLGAAEELGELSR